MSLGLSAAALSLFALGQTSPFDGGSFEFESEPHGLTSSSGPAVWQNGELSVSVQGPRAWIKGPVRMRLKWIPSPIYPGPPPPLAAVMANFLVTSGAPSNGTSIVLGSRKATPGSRFWAERESYLFFNPKESFDLEFPAEVLLAQEGGAATLKIQIASVPLGTALLPGASSKLLMENPLYAGTGLSEAMTQCAMLGEHGTASLLMESISARLAFAPPSIGVHYHSWTRFISAIEAGQWEEARRAIGQDDIQFHMHLGQHQLERDRSSHLDALLRILAAKEEGRTVDWRAFLPSEANASLDRHLELQARYAIRGRRFSTAWLLIEEFSRVGGASRRRKSLEGSLDNELQRQNEERLKLGLPERHLKFASSG